MEDLLKDGFNVQRVVTRFFEEHYDNCGRIALKQVCDETTIYHKANW